MGPAHENHSSYHVVNEGSLCSGEPAQVRRFAREFAACKPRVKFRPLADTSSEGVYFLYILCYV